MHSSCNFSRVLTIFIVYLDEINAFNSQGCTQCSWQTKCSCASSSQMVHNCTSLQGTLVGSTRSLNGWLLLCIVTDWAKIQGIVKNSQYSQGTGLFFFCCHVLPECPFRDPFHGWCLGKKNTMIAASDWTEIDMFWYNKYLFVEEIVDLDDIDMICWVGSVCEHEKNINVSLTSDKCDIDKWLLWSQKETHFSQGTRINNSQLVQPSQRFEGSEAFDEIFWELLGNNVRLLDGHCPDSKGSTKLLKKPSKAAAKRRKSTQTLTKWSTTFT